MSLYANAATTLGDDERYYIEYYDTLTEQNEQRVLATGTRCSIEREGVFIRGSVEHELPDGYYFQPEASRGSPIPSFTLEEGMRVRLKIR